MDSLRYLINELPDDVESLKQKSYHSKDWKGKTEDGHIPFALQSEENELKAQDQWLYY
jgi:hypothetical protein